MHSIRLSTTRARIVPPPPRTQCQPIPAVHYYRCCVYKHCRISNCALEEINAYADAYDYAYADAYDYAYAHFPLKNPFSYFLLRFQLCCVIS